MFIIQHRRRREKKTNYKKRLSSIKSGSTRLVIRRSVENIMIQFINYKKEGDVTVSATFSTELKKFGWKLPRGNIPAAYLTGLLAGVKAKGKVKDVILDLGIQRSTKGSRIYAALKGVVDSGVKVSHSEKIFPSEERIKGLHISEYAKKLGPDANKIFSKYIASGVSPEELPNHFEEIKNKIMVKQ